MLPNDYAHKKHSEIMSQGWRTTYKGSPLKYFAEQRRLPGPYPHDDKPMGFCQGEKRHDTFVDDAGSTLLIPKGDVRQVVGVLVP